VESTTFERTGWVARANPPATATQPALSRAQKRSLQQGRPEIARVDPWKLVVAKRQRADPKLEPSDASTDNGRASTVRADPVELCRATFGEFGEVGSIKPIPSINVRPGWAVGWVC
jgi:hypothetical protein